jgi:hypothetical protein
MFVTSFSKRSFRGLPGRTFLRIFETMKTRFVVILFVFNAAVLAAGYLFFSDYWGGQLEQDRAAAQTELAAWKAKAVETARPPPAVVVVQTNAFHWSQLESPDYRQYIANLRAIGCPEVTLKDIIMTDVMRLYAQRRGQYEHNGREFKFWETDEKRILKQTQLEEREKQLAQINKELPAVLRELLGINYEREMKKYFVDSDEDNRRLSFLSGDKRERLLALRDQFEGKRESVTYNLTNGPATPGDIDRLREIDKEQEEALSGLLSPEEKEEYQLSMSPTADHLRKELIGFNPTETEFRDLFRRQQAIDSAYAYEDMSDPTVRAAKAADEQSMMSDVKAGLGPERATALDKAKDTDYQTVSLLTERFDLPAETSQAIVDMRQAAEDEKKLLLANKDISPERLEVALKAIEAETEKAARETLGDQAYAQYSQSAGWIKSLGGN